jgi:hypothetical protein
MNSFGEILPITLKSLGMDSRFSAEMVKFEWRKIVGEEIAARAFPKKIDNGLLLVATNNAVWAHHLMTMKEDIILKLNNYMQKKVVRDIKFQAGYFINDQNQENTDEENNLNFFRKNIILSESELNELDSTTAMLNDKYLRNKIHQILKKDITLKKAKKSQGWKNCKNCGTLCPPDTILCTMCLLEEREENNNKVRVLIKQVPWISYDECKQYIECRVTDFNTIRREIMDAIINDIRHGNNDNLQLATLVMLVNSIKPDKVTSELLNNMLEKVRGKKNVFTLRG